MSQSGRFSSLASTPRAPNVRLWRGLALLFACAPFLIACEPEVGRRCGPPDQVNALVEQTPGSNDIVQDVSLDACAQPFCASTGGSRPYCTKTCTTDLDCAQAPGFSCGIVTPFGRLGCSDYEELGNSCTKDDGTPSDNPIMYCVAPPEVLENRDDEWGREEWPSPNNEPEPTPEPADGGP